MFRKSRNFCSVLRLIPALFFSISAGAVLAAQESTVFSFDGQDFIRVSTTLLVEDGSSAVNTKLDRSEPSYTALIDKRSYTGNATIGGRVYDANYAPLVDVDGKLTGAIFVGNEK